jgi:hypothetical protein
MGRRTRNGRRSAVSGRGIRTGRGRKVGTGSGGRGAAGAVYSIDIAGPWEPAALEALELDLRDLARRYGAELEEFRIQRRR